MPTGIAIVGSGFMASTHADAYARLGERVQVRYIVGRSEHRAIRLAERVGAQPRDDLASVLLDEEVVAVDICAPTDLHADFAVPALKADRYVMVEKPLARTLEQADRMISAARSSGGTLLVGHVIRHWSEYSELTKQFHAGLLGQPLGFTTLRLSAEPLWNDWMMNPLRSGGVAVDLLIHDIDLALQLFGPVTQIDSYGEFMGPATIVLQHSAGVTSSIHGSMGLPDRFPFSTYVRLDGTAGTAEYTFRTDEVVERGNLAEGARDAGLRVFVSGQSVRSVGIPSSGPLEAIAAEVEAFVSFVEGDTHLPVATAQEARAALAVALEAAGGLRDPVRRR